MGDIFNSMLSYPTRDMFTFSLMLPWLGIVKQLRDWGRRRAPEQVQEFIKEWVEPPLKPYEEKIEKAKSVELTLRRRIMYD